MKPKALWPGSVSALKPEFSATPDRKLQDAKLLPSEESLQSVLQAWGLSLGNTLCLAAQSMQL